MRMGGVIKIEPFLIKLEKWSVISLKHEHYNMFLMCIKKKKKNILRFYGQTFTEVI
jgi:hypothetical protein